MSEFIKLSQYTSAKVLEHFMLQSHHSLEAAAMRFMYAVMKDEVPPASSNLAQKSSVAGSAAIKKIEFRYDLFNEYTDQFFPFDTEPDLEALMLAAICDEYIEYAAPPEYVEEYEPSDLYTFLDHDLVNRARQIWEEASGIEAMGIPDDVPVLYESVMLAHINAMENLRELDENFDAYDYDDLKTIMEKDLKHIPAFALSDTDIGKELISQYAYIAQEIEKVSKAAQRPSPSGPVRTHLRVINPEDPTP